MTKLQAIVTLMVITLVSLPAMASFEVLYDFEDQTARTDIKDVRGGDQNGTTNQSSGNGLGAGPNFTPTGGRPGPQGNTGGMDFTNITPALAFSNMVQTQAVLDFPTAMTMSWDINPMTPPAQNMPTLWTGANRGAGETEFDIQPDGSINFNIGGGGGNATVPAGTIKFDGQYQSLAFTLGGGVFTAFIDGEVVASASGLATNLPGNGHAPNSPVQFGWLQNITAGVQDNFDGFLDNMFISDRALSRDEVAALHASFLPAIPEPASLSLLAMGGLVMFGRRRR